MSVDMGASQNQGNSRALVIRTPTKRPPVCGNNHMVIASNLRQLMRPAPSGGGRWENLLMSIIDGEPSPALEEDLNARA